MNNRKKQSCTEISWQCQLDIRFSQCILSIPVYTSPQTSTSSWPVPVGRALDSTDYSKCWSTVSLYECELIRTLSSLWSLFGDWGGFGRGPVVCAPAIFYSATDRLYLLWYMSGLWKHGVKPLLITLVFIWGFPSIVSPQLYQFRKNL